MIAKNLITVDTLDYTVFTNQEWALTHGLKGTHSAILNMSPFRKHFFTA